MNNISILFPDSVHFHNRNFKSLFDFIERHSIFHTFVKDRNNWVAAYGDYAHYRDELISYYNVLRGKSVDELYSFKVKNINVFDMCRDEALTIYLPQDDFRSKLVGAPDNLVLLRNMYYTDAEIILMNMSAAWSWIDFWSEKLSSVKNHTYACIFSGAQIYNRVLLELLKTHPTTPLVFEHFFTGNEYYVEEKYEPIPNNTHLKYDNSYKTTVVAELGLELNRVKIKAINKVLLAKNKNVTQPSGEFLISGGEKKVISIIGQVVNDFSIICTAKNYLSTIDFYCELIESILCDEDNFVVFKAHPWERNKNNLKHPLTYEKIKEFVQSLPIDKSSRVFVTEDFNLSDLIKQSDHIVTLCSQSAIEAAFLGVKPIQLGQAFYGKKGFTYDFDDIKSFILALKSGTLERYLTIHEYENLELFLVRFLEKELVSVHKSGILTLEKKLKPPPFIPLVKLSDVSCKHDENKKVIISMPKKSTKVKKLDKLIRTPDRFFMDSKHAILYKIGMLFKK